MSRSIDIKALAQAGVIFGHKASRWNPRMAPYIWGQKNGIHLIDVSKTALQLEKAGKFLESVAAEGKTILWVGTKKVAREVVQAVGDSLQQPYVKHRWVGGTLTNFPQVKKSVTKLLHFEDVLNKSAQFGYTKKEVVTFKKIAGRLEESVGSIRNLTYPIGAIVLIDIRKEDTALREALSVGCPVVGLVDTNSDPSMVDYVIPTNDDAPKAIRIIMDYLAESVKAGIAQAKAANKKPAPVKENVAAEETIFVEAITEDESEEAVALRKKARQAADEKKAARLALEGEAVADEKAVTKKKALSDKGAGRKHDIADAKPAKGSSKK